MKCNQTIRHRFTGLAKWTACVLVISAAVTACKKDDFSFQEQNRSIQMLDAIRNDTSLSIAVQALEKTGLAATLNTYGPFTFFAPDNNAFRTFFKNTGKSGLDAFAKDSLTTIMTYHILPARLKAAEFVQGPQSVSTGRGDFISIDISRGFKFNAVANGKANIYLTDQEYSNGLLHKMDAVLDPPILTIGQFLAQNQNLYSQFSAGLQKAGLTDTITNLNNALGQRIRLTLFVENNATLQQAGINYSSLTDDSTRYLMRNHIVPGAGFSSSYTRAGKPFTAIPTVNVIERYDSCVATLDGQDWIYFNLAAPKLINENNSFVSSDIILRNGIIHVVEKPLIWNPSYKRTQIFHRVWAEQVFCYGIPGFAEGAVPVANVSSGNFRWYYEGGPRNENFTFMSADGVNDSMVVVMRNIKKGSYRFTMNYKSAFNRGDFQLWHGTDSIGAPVNHTLGATYTQNLVIGTYKFATSGNKRLRFVCTRVGGINIENLVATPVY